MFGFDRHEIQRLTVSALGALMVSTACVVATVSPVKAAEPVAQSARSWQTEVEQRIDHELKTPRIGSVGVRVAVVAMRFDEAGNFASASIRKSSGIAAVDQEALRVANKLSYPALPTYLQGRPQTVAMQFHFGDRENEVLQSTKQARDIAVAKAEGRDRDRMVAEVAAQPEG